MHERPKLLIRPVKNCGLMNGLDEANEEESSLTEKKQIIDAIGSKDTVVLCTPVGN